MSIPQPEAVTKALVDLLDLTPAQGTPGLFHGASLPQPGGHVFGGQLMAQALVAMSRTVPSDRRPHSSFASFIEPALASEPLDFHVNVLRDGGSFSQRSIEVRQGERLVLSAQASFQERQDGIEHGDAAPMAPEPDSLPSTKDELAGLDLPLAQFMAHYRPIDIRSATGSLYFEPDAQRRREQLVWMRSLTPIEPGNQLLHDAFLTYASDYTPFEPTLRRQGLTWLTPGLRLATLNHSMWWHHDIDMNEWALYVQQSPAASGGRALSTGQVYSRDGRLVATIVQEGMFRIRKEPKATDHPAM